MTLLRLTLATLACWAAFALPARAQWLGSDYGSVAAPQINYAANSFLNFSVLNSNNRDAAAAAASRGASTLAPRAGRSTTAVELAARFPEAQRARLVPVFEDSLTRFDQVAAHLGLPRDDVAAALAAFLVGNWCALHGEDLPPDADFVALAGRLRGALVASPAFAKAGPAQRRQAYEQLAMVGMFMNTVRMSLVQSPNPAAQSHVRELARANLEQLLKVPADKLEIRGGQVALR